MTGTSVFNRVASSSHALLAAQTREYSLVQFKALDEYTRCTPWYRVLGVCVATVAPSTLLVVLLNLIPLRTPELGVQQNTNFFVRSYLGSALGAVGIGMQLHAAVPDAGLTPLKIVLIALTSALGFTGGTALLAVFWVFPVPWSIGFGSVPWMALFAIGLYLAIGRDRLRTTPQLQSSLRRAVNVLSKKGILLLIYPGFNAVHLQLSGLRQFAFLLVLPVMKVVMKRLVLHAAGSKGSSEIIPVMVTSVDVFDALFISKCMQNSASFWSGAGLIVFHAIESAHSITHLHKMTQRCGERRQPEHLFDSMGGVGSAPLAVPAFTVKPTSSTVTQLVRAESLRTELQKPAGRWGKSTRGKRVHPKPIGPSLLLRVFPSELAVVTSNGRLATTPTPSLAEHQIHSSEHSARDMQRSLQLLYSSELLLLVEYYECAIPAMYAIYLVTLFHLPNSRFFPELASLSSEKLSQITSSIAMYALLELASLVCVHVAFKAKFNTSAFHQLGFVLERNFVYLQGTFLVWTVLMADFTLVHNGTYVRGFLPRVL